MDTKQVLNDILKEFYKIDYVKPEDIPNIDLYMDQVTTFMDTHLGATRRYDEDKVLTKTMINNYAKNNLLPPPVKKKYSKEHMLMLIFIYYFKSLLSFRDIEELFKPITAKHFTGHGSSLSLEDIYREVFTLEESEMCVGDLAVLLNMTKSAVSHQLKVLRTAKLVRAEKKGKNVYYALNDHHVKSILEKALEHVCE